MHIVILASYYPPLNSIATFRPLSWAQTFSKEHKVTVFTQKIVEQHGNLNSDTPQFSDDGTIVIEESPIGQVIRVPIVKHARDFGKASLFLGIYNRNIDIFRTFYDPLKEFVKQNKVDLVICTLKPVELAKVCYHIHKDTGTKYIVDFRDAWFLFLGKKKMTIRQKVMHKVFSPLIQKWVSKALMLTAVSEPILNLVKHSNKKVIFNGFFEKDFHREKKQFERFTISCTGQIYAYQDLNTILRGFEMFEKKVGHSDISINFVGLPKKEHYRISDYNLKSISITERMPKNSSDEYLYGSHVLFYIGWEGWKGIYSGKIFEFLSTNTNILIAPSDHDVIEELIEETKSGFVANTPKEVFQVLLTLYEEWRRNGSVLFKGDINAIKKYTRENQAETFLQEICKIIK